METDSRHGQQPNHFQSGVDLKKSKKSGGLNALTASSFASSS